MAPKSKAKAVKGSTANESRSKPEPLLRWPPLLPLAPMPTLSLEPLLEDQIFVIRTFFTSKLCKAYIEFLSTLPLTTTPGKPKKGEAARVNDRFQVEDVAFANRLWNETGLHDLILAQRAELWGGDVLGLNSRIRVYRYSAGQFFDQHYDESNRVIFGPDRIPAKTTWTLLIYLSTCEGGETAFYPEWSGKKGEIIPESILVGMETGMALLHRHEPDCLLHEGKEVKSGEKWVLRSDLVVKR